MPSTEVLAPPAPPVQRRSRWLRWTASGLLLVLVAAIAGGGWLWFKLNRSMPLLDGDLAIRGVTAPVAITRDAAGVPTIRGANRWDVAVALGFLHAQDRFFQMDLSRRRAAGELAEVFGRAAVPLDRLSRPHEFRRRAEAVVDALPADQRQLLESYASGVNAGLAALGATPFEYLMLRQNPKTWKPEDTVLAVYAMALELQDTDGKYERSLAAIRHQFGEAGLKFFAPVGTDWDAALDESTFATAPIPGVAEVDLRERSHLTARAEISDLLSPPAIFSPPDGFVGSNGFVLGAAHAANHAPLLAGDVHLGLRVPNTWYRAQLIWADEKTGGQEHRVIGVTLPGVPNVICGSNGEVAWSLVNAYIDTTDLVIVEPDPANPDAYRVTDQETAKFETRRATITVKDGAPVPIATTWTKWGPVVGVDPSQHSLALRWTLHDAGTIDFTLAKLETASSAREALTVAHLSGIPTQNLLVADRAGDMAWTICGKIPRRVGWEGRLPASWRDGRCFWDGYLAPDEYPVVLNPPAGRLWVANNRTMGGGDFAHVGDGGYDVGARAKQIRDDLTSLNQANPGELLAVQLDDRALFLERWQRLFLLVAEHDPSLAQAAQLVAAWGARADVSSVGYTLVRAWRDRVIELTFAPMVALCRKDFPDFSLERIHLEQPLWAMIQAKPLHLLNPQFPSWDALLHQAAVDIVARTAKDRRPLSERTWGRRNTARIRHPLAGSVPAFFADFLNMPSEELPGDRDMPRVQSPTFGAAARMVVSPGHEDEGIFEMPGGQCGHPLSPFYRAGHAAWVKGVATALLPGTPLHTLTLRPDSPL